MGLAGFASPHEVNRARRKLTPIFQSTVEGDFYYSKRDIRFEQLFRRIRRAADGLRFDGIAGALQEYLEKIVPQWIGYGLERTSSKQVVFAGGLAHNVKLNSVILKTLDIQGLFVPPGPGDESNCIGAAYIGSELIRESLDLPEDFNQPLRHGYIGPSVRGTDIDRALTLAHKAGININPLCHEDVAEDLVLGKIVGRCAGRMEFGARALGNRSIFVDPQRMDVAERLNRGVKERDFWMPFAPATTRERSGEYLEISPGADVRFMTVACDTTEKGRRLTALSQVRPYLVAVRSSHCDFGPRFEMRGPEPRRQRKPCAVHRCARRDRSLACTPGSSARPRGRCRKLDKQIHPASDVRTRRPRSSPRRETPTEIR